MEFAYRILVFSFPFIVSLVAYFWISKKTLASTIKFIKILCFVLIAAGVGFTFYQLAISMKKALQDDGFNFKVIFFNILFWVAISIILAFGTPDEDGDTKASLN